MTAPSCWHPPPESLVLPREEVHVWRVALDPDEAVIHALKGTLSAVELERAGRFYFAKDRRAFTVARGVLRTVLGRYLGQPPQQIAFTYGPHGKPALPVEPGQPSLCFNLSHSGNLALIAAAWGREIGVDVEQHRVRVNAEPIAERFFSPAEVAVFTALPAEQKQAAFFACWTRKEAYIKARGKGLAIPLDEFDVSLRPGEAARLLATRDDPREAGRWSLRELEIDPGYSAALMVEGEGWQLQCWRWNV